MKTINIGLIGCGYWGKNYVSTLGNIDDCNLCWIYNKHNEIPKQKLPSGVKFTKCYHDILQDADVHAIIIATPPGTHHEIAMNSLLADKDVLVEKPFTCNSSKSLSLLSLAEKKSRVLMVGHIFLYNPAVIELKRLIDANELGNLLYFFSRRSGPGPVSSDVSAMWSMAPHDISMINFLNNGKLPVMVSANGGSYLKHHIEDVADLVLEYENNVKAFIHVGWMEPKKTRETTIVGDLKKAVIDDMSEKKLTLYDSGDPNNCYHPDLEKISPLENQCRHFLKCVSNGAIPLTDGYDGYANDKILECAQNSLQTGAKVKTDILDRHIASLIK